MKITVCERCGESRHLKRYDIFDIVEVNCKCGYLAKYYNDNIAPFIMITTKNCRIISDEYRNHIILIKEKANVKHLENKLRVNISDSLAQSYFIL